MDAHPFETKVNELLTYTLFKCLLIFYKVNFHKHDDKGQMDAHLFEILGKWALGAHISLTRWSSVLKRWEQAEAQILNQVRILHEWTRFPLRLNGHVVITSHVASVFPKNVVGTEVGVALKTRKRNSNSGDSHVGSNKDVVCRSCLVWGSKFDMDASGGADVLCMDRWSFMSVHNCILEWLKRLYWKRGIGCCCSNYSTRRDN
ncbi:unnamed protein product [Vicia faba]|uniref:Uncharacterized protein n=1 Tax=Vicia faba TaxID=3906 RepID=A0AAV0YVX3_VICFA|nr:unnamed protein product [Vicia faba]